MTVEENLVLGGFARRKEGAKVLADIQHEIYELFARLKERHHQLAGTLSGGERQMLALGRALMGRPKLLTLDEPSLGLAPRIVREIFKIIIRLGERGASLLIVEQNARAALQIADYGYVIEQSRVALEGPVEQLQYDEGSSQAISGGTLNSDTDQRHAAGVAPDHGPCPRHCRPDVSKRPIGPSLGCGPRPLDSYVPSFGDSACATMTAGS